MLIEIDKLSVNFLSGRRVLRAVNNVSLGIRRGEMVGLVGESGCGKSTLGRAILKLVPMQEGRICYEGIEINRLPTRAFTPYRKKMQMVFQDPYSSLNPTMPVCDIVGEAFAIHKLLPKRKRAEAVEELLSLVKLDNSLMPRYPHELSGGQRQRVGIARALALKPEFLFCDEPISALDTVHQADIAELLQNLQRELNLTCLFVSHDLSVVKHLSQRIAVMYLGEIIELIPSGKLSEQSLHPYTQALLSSLASPDPRTERKKNRIILNGEMPNPYNPPTGCPFHPRCPKAKALCREQNPPNYHNCSEHYVRCHFPS